MTHLFVSWDSLLRNRSFQSESLKDVGQEKFQMIKCQLGATGSVRFLFGHDTSSIHCHGCSGRTKTRSFLAAGVIDDPRGSRSISSNAIQGSHYRQLQFE